MATQDELNRMMSIYRHATVPRRYNITKDYYTPDPETYKYDALDPSEMEAVRKWVVDDDNATRRPGDVAGTGLTINPSTHATVTASGNDFVITCTQAGVFEVTGATPPPPTSGGGWYLLSFDVYSENKNIVILNALGGTDETFAVSGGCGNSDPEFDCLQGKVAYVVYVNTPDVGLYDKIFFGIENMQVGDVLKLTNLEISRVEVI